MFKTPFNIIHIGGVFKFFYNFVPDKYSIVSNIGRKSGHIAHCGKLTPNVALMGGGPTSNISSLRRGSELNTSPWLKVRTRQAVLLLFFMPTFFPQHWLKRCVNSVRKRNEYQIFFIEQIFLKIQLESTNRQIYKFGLYEVCKKCVEP